jgi:dihydroorotase-like cyclic amidohydrolase
MTIRILLCTLAPALLSAQTIALRVGHLVDPEAGAESANQVILVQAGKFTAIAANVGIPAGAEVVDLSQYYVSPGLVDAHNHSRSPTRKSPSTTAII